METVARGDRTIVAVEGDLLWDRLDPLADAVDEAAGSAREVLLDVSGVGRFDSAGAEFLLRRLKHGDGRVRLRNARAELRSYLQAMPPPEMFRGEMTTILRPAVSDFIVDTATDVVEHVSDQVRQFGSLFLQFVYFTTIGPFRGHRVRTDRAISEVVVTGIDALPIVALVSVLMGLILGFQSAAQLEKFGGESLFIYSANMVGVSITREIGPILTAILIAGRSGSAITAEIGTMAVTEELDALRVMGMNPVSFLVVPKILGLLLALPCLVIVADLVGIAGGFVTGVVVLGVPLSEYWRQTQEALHLSDVFTGLVKAAVFGLLIGLTGAANGMQVRGGSQDVGLKTTKSVVVSIALVIVADLVFTMLFFVGDV
ncbi:MAG: ABC transporter permease [Planctomycetota bacterium JB042]